MSDLYLFTDRIEDEGARQEEDGKHDKDSTPRVELEKEKNDQGGGEYADWGTRIVNRNGFTPPVFGEIFRNERYDGRQIDTRCSTKDESKNIKG